MACYPKEGACNAFSDYLSLFVIRPFLIRSGTKPVVGLALGAVTGAAIVLGANTLRETVLGSYFYGHGEDFWPLLLDRLLHADLLLKYTSYYLRGAYSRYGTEFALPAMAVFVWLPLFALGIVAARLLTPLSWIVGRTQWFLKEGKEHPLKAIGYVAAVVVFLGTVVGRLVFSA